MLGPLEFVVIKFKSNHFSGDIVPRLVALRDGGCVHLVDLVYRE